METRLKGKSNRYAVKRENIKFFFYREKNETFIFIKSAKCEFGFKV